MGFLLPEHAEIIELLHPSKAPEYLELLDRLGYVVENKVLPYAEAIDREARFPKESMKLLFEQGLIAMSFKEEEGGLGLPYTLFIMALEMVAKACASTALSLDIHSTVCEGISLFGNEEQKREYLKPLIMGDRLAAFALTEPQGGSNAGAIRLMAEPKGDGYLLKGSKVFITNAGVADVYLVFARTPKGITAFLVDGNIEGLSIGKELSKLGVRGSRTAELVFNDAYVDKSSMLGEEGKGFNYAKTMLNSGRITIAATCIGIAQMAYERSARYAMERESFGRKLSEHQLIQEKIADMVIGLSSSRWLTYTAAALRDSGKPFASEAAQAKVLASETALKICDEAIQILGGYGYAGDEAIHRHWRDARLMTIGEGTSEILRLLVAKMALKGIGLNPP